MRRITEGLYLLEEAGCANAYLIEGSADLTLVDAGSARSAPGLIQEIKDNGFHLKDIGRIVVTHAHPDHAGGIGALHDVRPIKVYAHPQDIPALTGKQRVPTFRGVRGFFKNMVYERLMRGRALETVMPVVPGTPIRAIPQWQFMHTPGHTDGSLSLFHPVRQILICGDVLVNEKGVLGIPNNCYNQDEVKLHKSLKALSKLDCDVLCCGHGGVVRGGAFRYIEAVAARKRRY